MSIRSDESKLVKRRQELNEKISSIFHLPADHPDYVETVKELKRTELKLKKIQDLRDFILQTVHYSLDKID